MQQTGKSLPNHRVACAAYILVPLLPPPLVQLSQGLSVAETSAPIDTFMETSSGRIPYSLPKSTINQEESRRSNGPTIVSHIQVLS